VSLDRSLTHQPGHGQQVRRGYRELRTNMVGGTKTPGWSLRRSHETGRMADSTTGVAALDRDRGDCLLCCRQQGSPLTARSWTRILASTRSFCPWYTPGLRSLTTQPNRPTSFVSCLPRLITVLMWLEDATIVVPSASGDKRAYSRYAALLR